MAYAFGVARTRLCPIMAKVEATYNTTPTPAGGTDDVLGFNADNPVGFDVGTFELRPLGDSFTHKQHIIGQRVYTMDFMTMLQSSGADGAHATPTTGQGALLQCAGMKETITGPSPGPGAIVYTLATPTTIKSSWIVAELEGKTHTMGGAYANCVMSGNPTTGVECRWRVTSMFTAPTHAPIANWTGGTNLAQPFLNVGCTMTPAGGSAYTPVLQSFELDLGVRVDRVLDCNNATGLKQLLFSDRAPKMTLVIALDTGDGGTADYETLYADLAASTTHAVGWTIGTRGTSYTRVTYAAPTAQLTGIALQSTNGYRTVALTYNVQSNTNEAEFSITLD